MSRIRLIRKQWSDGGSIEYLTPGKYESRLRHAQWSEHSAREAKRLEIERRNARRRT